jgi:hypothetical protein
MAATPLEQVEVAVATYCTLGDTLLLLAGAETYTVANAEVPKLRMSRESTDNFIKISS